MGSRKIEVCILQTLTHNGFFPQTIIKHVINGLSWYERG